MELLQIETELKGAGAEEALRRYDDVLVKLDDRLKAAQRAGMDPATYAKCAPLAEAVTVARKLMRLEMRKDG